MGRVTEQRQAALPEGDVRQGTSLPATSPGLKPCGALAQPGKEVMSNVPVASCLLTRWNSGVTREQLPHGAAPLNPVAHLSSSGSTSLGFARNIKKGLTPLTGTYIKRVHTTESTLKLAPPFPSVKFL